MSQRPLTLILLQKYRDTNGRRIVIQIGGVYTTLCQKRAYFCQSMAIEMGGVSRYFSKVSGSGVDLVLLRERSAVNQFGRFIRPRAELFCWAARPRNPFVLGWLAVLTGSRRSLTEIMLSEAPQLSP